MNYKWVYKSFSVFIYCLFHHCMGVYRLSFQNRLAFRNAYLKNLNYGVVYIECVSYKKERPIFIKHFIFIS